MKSITTTIFVILTIFMIGCSTRTNKDYNTEKTISYSVYKGLLEQHTYLVEKYNSNNKKLSECYTEKSELKNKIMLKDEKWAELLWTGNYYFSPSDCDNPKNTFTMCRYGCDIKFYCDTNSMYPLFSCKDKLTLEECSTYSIGDIILFENKYKSIDYEFLIHQIVDIEKNKIITKGFNNQGKDNFTTDILDIKGKVVKIEYR